MADNRVRVAHSLFAQTALRIVEPNMWLTNLPAAIGTINTYISVTGGSNYIEKRKFKPVIAVGPLEDFAPKE